MFAKIITSLFLYYNVYNWAVKCDFQPSGILTSVESDEPVHPSF